MVLRQRRVVVVVGGGLWSRRRGVGRLGSGGPWETGAQTAEPSQRWELELTDKPNPN